MGGLRQRHDELMREALNVAAADIQDAKSFLEKYVDDALAAALERRWPGAKAITRATLPLLDWERLASSRSTRRSDNRESDLQVIAPGDSSPCLLSEQKVWDFDASLFDVA